MLGKLLRVDENTLTYENRSDKSLSYLMNCHLVFDETDRKLVGELIRFNEKEVDILLIGEIRNNCFFPGTIKKPSN